MVKTQVQIPDHLYKEAKRIAAEYELSFAEVVRRGLERVVPTYPPRAKAVDWVPPEPRKMGCKNLTAAQLRDFARGEGEVPAWWTAERKGQK